MIRGREGKEKEKEKKGQEDRVSRGRKPLIMLTWRGGIPEGGGGYYDYRHLGKTRPFFSNFTGRLANYPQRLPTTISFFIPAAVI